MQASPVSKKPASHISMAGNLSHSAMLHLGRCSSGTSDFVFKVELHIFGTFSPCKYIFYDRMNNVIMKQYIILRVTKPINPTNTKTLCGTWQPQEGSLS